MATNTTAVAYTTEEIFGNQPVVRTTEQLFPKKIPSMLSPKYWWGAAKKIPGQAYEMMKGLAEIGPTLTEKMLEVEPTTPMEALEFPATVAKEVVGPMAGEMGKGLAEDIYKTITRPKESIYERPLDVGINATILGGAVVGGLGKAVKGIKALKRGQSLAKDIKSINRAGQVVKKTVGKVPDELVADDILTQSAKLATGEAPTQLELKYGGMDLKQVLDQMDLPHIQKQAKYVFDNFHSPDKVLGKHPSGQIIYEALDRADLAKLHWVDKEFKRFSEAAKGIKEGGPLDTGIFKIRDAQLKMSDVFKMTPDEATKFNLLPEELSAIKKSPEFASKWNDFLGKNFDYLLRRWGRSLLNEGAETNIWKAVNKSRKQPVSKQWLQKLTEDERVVFDMYQRRIQDYMPHIFNRSEVIGALESELSTLETKVAKMAPESKQYSKLKKEQIQVNESLQRIRGGEPLLYDILPSKIRFRFFEKRKGAHGYQVSGTKAYKTYLSGIAKKIFDEPALRRSIAEFDKLPMEMRPYARWYLRDFMGWNKTPLTSLAGTIKSLQWIRTLGFNPRSAMVNLTQRVNTIAEAGPEWSAKGYLYGFTDEGKTLFESTGIPKTIPSVLMEGAVPHNALEGLRSIAGFLFQKVEYGNQKHAFLTGYLRGVGKGVSKERALQEGINLFEKAQFRYGRVGMPKALRGVGGVAFQFWSYPIKQIEFLSTLAKENPAKLLGWFAMAEGGRHSLEEFAGLDLSNALGMGFNYGELIDALQSIDDKDIKKVRYHLAQSDVPLMGGGGGGGIFPYGFGPAIGALERIIKVFGDVNSEFDDLAGEMEPVTMVRLRQFEKALREKEGDEYPIYHPYKEERLYLEKLPQLISRTGFLKPFEETRQQRKRKKDVMLESMYRRIQQQISELMAQGELPKALNLAQKYHIPISDMSIEAAIRRRKLTREERQKESTAMAPFKQYMRQ